MQDVIILGAGGHAKGVANIVLKSNDNLLGFLDDNIAIGTNVLCDYKVLGKISDCEKYKNEIYDVKFVIAIGDNNLRQKISENYLLNFYTAIHPNSCIGIDTTIEEGTVIMAYAAINSSSKIGKHCIINTGAIVEHDNVIGDFVHISPNAVLGGNVTVLDRTHIGIGATIRNNITISSDSLIGAGAVVVKNVEITGTYIGIPAKLKLNSEL